MSPLRNHRLINAVLEASFPEMERRGLALFQTVRALFELVEAGVRDFKVLKEAALAPQNAATGRSRASGCNTSVFMPRHREQSSD